VTMEGPPTVEAVVTAVSSLYHDPDPKVKEAASKWLNQLQKSVYAWTISDQLLQRQLDVETCYFAAQTMRSKIQYSFSELPTSSHSSLRSSLMTHLTSLTPTTSQVIITQLCLAMADLILLMPEWNTALSELMSALSSNHTLPLLEVLLLLPEEVDSRHLRLGANRRQQVKEMLTASSTHITQFLASVLNSGQDQIKIVTVKCYSSWMTLGAISLDTVLASPVMGCAVAALSSPHSHPTLHEAASDCMISLLGRIEREDCGDLEQNTVTTVQQLATSYQNAVAEEDMEKCLNYCRVFTELGESFLIKIVSSPPGQPHFSLPILDTVLLCCQHPDYEMPDVTFNLWYRLSEELYTRNDDSLVSVFKPQVERLIGSLCRHCQMEPDTVGILEEGEDFTEFRVRVCELIKDCVFIVGSSTVFRQMYHLLQQSCQWEQTEAALYIMAAVARNILPEEDSVVPAVLQQVLSLPTTIHTAVRLTATKLVGELCEWIEKHPDSLQATLNYLLQGLQDPVLASEAATALQNICSQCRDHMAEHFNGLLQILEQIDKFNLKPEAANGLIKGVVMIISIMNQDQLKGAVEKVCLLQVTPLNNIMNNLSANTSKIVKHSVTDPVLYLDRLSAVFRHVQPSNGCQVSNSTPHPCRGTVESVWPVLSRCLELYQGDVRVTERTCRTIRFAIRCIGVQSSNLLQPLVTQLVALYEVKGHSCYLYLGSILVDEYASETGCIPGLLSMLQAFISPTYGLLAAAGGLTAHPDTVDDFFRLNARFLQRAPMPYLQTEFIKSILECALLSAALEHRDANASVMKFFYDLLHAGRTREDNPDFEARSHLIKSLHSEYGGKLVDSLVRAAVTTLPSYTYHDIGDVIHECLQHDRVSVCSWLENSLKSLQNSNSSHPTAGVTTKQLVEFHRAVTSAETAPDVSQAIREFVRLWR